MAKAAKKPDGVTWIHFAVDQLRVSLDRSEEAALHVAQVRDLSDEIFVRYRLAFGDAGAPAVEAASEMVEAASALTELVLGRLEKAKEAIREYSATIAPNISLTDSGEVRSSPSGEELLETAPRARSARNMTNILVGKTEDISTVVHDGFDITTGVVGIFDRPDTSGYVSATQVPGPYVHETSGATGSAATVGDLFLPAALGATLVVKAVEIAATWIAEKITRRKRL